MLNETEKNREKSETQNFKNKNSTFLSSIEKKTHKFE